MKILLIGSEGQLGKSLIKAIPKDLELIESNKKNLNLENGNSIITSLKTINPDWVINCGAYTSVDKAEFEKKITFKINGMGPYFLAKYLKDIGGKLVQISSDFVFDGESNKAYNTDHPLRPINVYGESKAMAENLLTSKESNFDDIFF